jgi:hypothetical protein
VREFIIRVKYMLLRWSGSPVSLFCFKPLIALCYYSEVDASLPCTRPSRPFHRLFIHLNESP